MPRTAATFLTPEFLGRHLYFAAQLHLMRTSAPFVQLPNNIAMQNIGTRFDAKNRIREFKLPRITCIKPFYLRFHAS
jgi:hypothetical protein